MMDAFSFIKTDLAKSCDFMRKFSAFRHRSVSFYHNLLAIMADCYIFFLD